MIQFRIFHWEYSQATLVPLLLFLFVFVPCFVSVIRYTKYSMVTSIIKENLIK